MASITPLVSSSNTEESTTQTTPQNSDVVITGASLTNGTKYLVMYCAAFGGSDTSAEVEVTVEQGSTVIARAIGEGSSSGTPASMRIKSIHGYYIITGDGSSDLRIKYRCLTTADTAYIKGKTLIAIPLDQLTEDTHYYKIQQNSDTDQVTNALSDFSTNLITLTKTLDAGDYLVLMSAEIKPHSVTASGLCRFVVDSANQKVDFSTEGEASTIDNEYINFSYAKIHTLTSGSKTFKIDVASSGSAIADARRGRIIIINKAYFNQIISVSSTTENSVTGTTWTDYLSQAYTPNQQEYVVLIGNVMTRSGTNFDSQLIRLLNSTDTTYFSDQVSADSANYTNDKHALTAFGCEQISAAKTYKLQFRSEDASGTAYIDEGDLIIWGLTFDPIGYEDRNALCHVAQARPWSNTEDFEIISAENTGYEDRNASLDINYLGFEDRNASLNIEQTGYFDRVASVSVELSVIDDRQTQLDVEKTGFFDKDALLEVEKTSFLDRAASLEVNYAAWEDRSTALDISQAAYKDRSASLSIELSVLNDRQAVLEIEKTAFEDRAASLEVEKTNYTDRNSVLDISQAAYFDKDVLLEIEKIAFKDRNILLNIERTSYFDKDLLLDVEQTTYKDWPTSLSVEFSVLSDRQAALNIEKTSYLDRASALDINYGAWLDRLAQLEIEKINFLDRGALLDVEQTNFFDRVLQLNIERRDFLDINALLEIEKTNYLDYSALLQVRKTSFLDRNLSVDIERLFYPYTFLEATAYVKNTSFDAKIKNTDFTAKVKKTEFAAYVG